MRDPEPTAVDYHVHLDLFRDYKSQFETCAKNGIATLAVTTTPRAWETNKCLAAESNFVRAALGFHPQLVAEIQGDFPLFEKLIHKTRFIGEVGLDASPRYYRSFEKQKQVFTQILKLCAESRGKILSVHCVRAGHQLLDMIEEHLPRNLGRVVLHWFSGTAAEAKRAVALGCHFSINREMFKNPDRHGLIAALPHERVLTETDGPFTAMGGRPAAPSDVTTVIPLIAQVWRLPESVVATQIKKNLMALEDEQVT